VALYEDEYKDVQKISRYICPKCGIIQVDVGDI
jgi:ribosomal protein S27AE